MKPFAPARQNIRNRIVKAQSVTIRRLFYLMRLHGIITSSYLQSLVKSTHLGNFWPACQILWHDSAASSTSTTHCTIRSTYC